MEPQGLSIAFLACWGPWRSRCPGGISQVSSSRGKWAGGGTGRPLRQDRGRGGAHANLQCSAGSGQDWQLSSSQRHMGGSMSGEQAHFRGPEEPPLSGVSRWPLSDHRWLLGCSTEDPPHSWRPEGHTTSSGPTFSSQVNVTRGL